MLSTVSFDLCDVLRTAEDVLIVGAGHSATSYKDLGLRDDYDVVLTINNASQTAVDADFYLVEPANNANFSHMVSGLDLKKVIVKERAFSKLSPDKLKEMTDIYEAANLPIQCVSYSIPSAKLWGLIRVVAAKCSSRSVQWCGSLSLLIDCCVKAKVPHIGFIGTDFGGKYAVEPDWKVRSIITHSLATKRRRGYSFFYIVKALKLVGYFGKTSFSHHHNSSRFESLL
jgi:hypothetical protein